jgi:hypothetical protein
MQVFNLKNVLPVFICATFFAACKKEITQEVIYDNIIYNIDTVPVYAAANDKDRLKTPLQYISSLYSNLYFASIPAGELDDLVIYRLSIGDKTLVNEMILNAMLKDPEVYGSLPSNDEMRSDLSEFIDITYLRFFLRYPTEYEKYGLKQIIEEDETITVTDVYRSFLLSNEYMFY